MAPSITRARDAVAALTALHAGEHVDRDVLLAWDGWGSLAPALGANPEGGWAEIADLAASLPDVDAAADVVDTSFFTPRRVIDAVYAIAKAAGVHGGRALELGCGTGRFIEAADPTYIFTGVENDPTSARIAAALHPQATIIADHLQRVTLPRTFDVAVGNVPFSAAMVFDRAYGSRDSIHRYFIRRAVDALRPGGIGVIVSSRHTLDSAYPIDGVELLGALRLPVQAFAETGASVVADILIVRAATGDRPWPPLGADRVSTYWREHPDHIAGSMKTTGWSQNPVTVDSDDYGNDLARAARAVSAHVAGAYSPAAAAEGVMDDVTDVVLTDADGRMEGSFHIDGATLVQIADGIPTPVVRASKELRALVALRDAASALLEADLDDTFDPELREQHRRVARHLYETYVAAHGPLNRGTLVEGKVDADTGLPALSWRRPSMGGFRRDPGYFTVMALEEYDQGRGVAAAAPILRHRTNAPLARPASAATPADALAISLGESGRIDLDRIADLLDVSDAEAALGTLVWRTPAGALVTAADYLSGDIRSKIDEATAAGLTRHVDALKVVMPAQLGAEEIACTLGAPWIAATYVADFAQQVLGFTAGGVSYDAASATWDVTGSVRGIDMRRHWGTPAMDAERILQHALDGTMPIVYDDLWDASTRRNKRVRNNDATLAAEDRRQAMQERFSVWVWEEGERAAAIAAEFNRRFRSHAPRVYDGSHLTFPGMSADLSLWSHQRRMIERSVSSPRALCAHAVGAGKTLTFIATAMLLRRFGLARKPLIAVPNHLLEQVAREAQQAFPTGRFLVATREDMAGDGKRLFAARCQQGDWDAVVMTHQAFTSLPVSAEAEEAWVRQQMDELADSARHSTFSEYGSGRAAKAVARARRNLTSRIEELRDGVADQRALHFDHLGVDYLMIDEAHGFKRLGTASRMDGFSTGSSKRAADLAVKIEALAMRHPGKPVVTLYTGTPWSNTIAETYVWQRYLQPDRLAAAGVAAFDTWAPTFVQFETRIEVSPDAATFRLQSRPTTVQNVPELMGMLGEVADIVTSDQLDLQRPVAVVENVLVEPHPAQVSYVAGLADRADALRSGGAMLGDGRKDNMLLICTEGRHVALDPALVGVAAHSPKVAAVADRVADVWAQQASTAYGAQSRPGALQLVFCDLGTPDGADTRTYGRLRRALVDRGVPANEVRFVHEATTGKAREALFEQCRDGRVSVLIGSTDKLGTGTNVQDRLVHVHHLDAPWRPSDITQRDGRAIRPGNLNASVGISRYVTERTFDAFMWQTLERKARFIDQLLSLGGESRTAADIGDQQLSFGEVKALASGNPMLLEHANLQAQVKRLRILAAVHRQGIVKARFDAESATRQAHALRGWADAAEAALLDWPDDASLDTDALGAMTTTPAYGRIALAGALALAPAREERGRRGLHAVRITHSYREIEVLEVPKKVARDRGALGSYLRHSLEALRTDLPSRIESSRAEADSLIVDGARAVAAADSNVFPKADELRQHEVRLERVEAELAASAGQDREAA